MTQDELFLDLVPQQRPGCAAGDMSDQYIGDLISSTNYRTDGEMLLLDMEYDTGTLTFSRSEQ